MKCYVQLLWRLQLPECPRCGRPHEDLELSRFVGGLLLERYAFWASCPRTGAPILVEGEKWMPQASHAEWREAGDEFELAVAAENVKLGDEGVEK